MSNVVQTRARAIAWSSQTNLPRQRIERSMNLSAIQTVTHAGNEQIRGHYLSCPMTLSLGDVLFKHGAGRGMQRHEASLAELGAADCQNRRFQIDILKFEVARLADAQARNTEEAE